MTVSFASDDHGSLNQTSSINVDYGSAYSFNGNNLMIGNLTVVPSVAAGFEASYVFDKWTVNGGEVPATKTITQATSFKALFKLKTLTLTFTVEGDGGTLTKTPGDSGQTSIEIEATYGAKFAKSGDDYLIGESTSQISISPVADSGFGFEK